MKWIKTTSVAAAIFAFATSAFGQTAWDGGYYGLALGADQGSTDFTYNAGAGVDVGHDLSGTFIGGYAGYNIQNGSIVYGVEAEYGVSNLAGTAPCPNPDWTCETAIGAIGSVRLRAGYASGDWLFYGQGGYAFGEVTASTTDIADNVYPETLSATGWTAGLGAERQVANSPWIMRFEYSQYTFDPTIHGVDFTNEVLVNPVIQSVRLGLSRRF